MSATQIIDFLQSNAVLITYDPLVEYPAGYIVEKDQALYISNDIIPAGTTWAEGSTGETWSVLNPTNGLTDAELRAAPVDVTSSVMVTEKVFITVADGPAPVEYLEGHMLRRTEFYDTASNTSTFIWMNISTNTGLTVSPLPGDVIYSGPSTEIKQDVGNQVLNDIKTRLPTTVGLKTEDLSLSVTLANNNSVMQVAQYNVITAGTGYTVGNVLRKTTFFNHATGATSTKWYNVSTTVVLTTAPNLAHLTARTDKIAAIGQLPAVLGKLTEAESLSVVQTNANSSSVVDVKMYDVLVDGVDYVIGDVLRRIETFDAISKVTTITWYNTTTSDDIAAPILADLSLQVQTATQDQKFALTNSITLFDVINDATEYTTGDVLRRLEIFDPIDGTTAGYWYNMSTGADISTPIGGDIVQQVNLNDNSVVHQTYTYGVVNDGADYATGDIIFRVESLDPTTGQLTSVWRNLTDDVVIAEPVMADIVLAGVSSPLVYSQLPTGLGKKTEAQSLSVVVANKMLEVYEMYKYTATGNAANGTDYLVGHSILAIDYIDKSTSIITRTWRNTTLNTVLSTAPNALHLSSATSNAGLLYTQLPTSLGKKTEALSLSVVVANPDNSDIFQTINYTATVDATNGTDYLIGHAITKIVYINKSTSVLTTVWRNSTLDTVLTTAPNALHLGTGVVANPLQYGQLPASLGVQDEADSLSVVVANPDSTILNNTYKYTATADDVEYLTGDVIEAYEIFDKVSLETTIHWKNITQDTILTAAPDPADLSAPTVDAPLVYSQLPASLGKKTDANSLSVVVSNPDSTVVDAIVFYTATADSANAGDYFDTDMLSMIALLDKATGERSVIWRNETLNSVLTNVPDMADLTVDKISRTTQYDQLPVSLGKKAEADSLSVVVSNPDNKVLQGTMYYMATVAGTGYAINDTVARYTFLEIGTALQTNVWRNITQNTTIATPTLADLSPGSVVAPLQYGQLPSSLGKKTEANSLSVVVANSDSKLLKSVTSYTAIEDSTNAGDYFTGNKITEYVYLNTADSSTITVWRNETQGTTLTPPPPQSDLGSPVVSNPLEYSQLPSALGLQAEEDSLSVVVANPDGKVWISSDYYEATLPGTGYVLGDKITKFNYLDIKNSEFVTVWKNITTNTTIAAPNMLDVQSIVGDKPLKSSQLPASLGLQDTADSLSVAVSNQNPSFVSVAKYTVIADDAINSQYLINDVLNKYTFINPTDGVVTTKWYNVTQETVIFPPLGADITGGTGGNTVSTDQLPAALGLQDAADSLSVVVAGQKAPLLHSSRTYLANTDSVPAGAYEVGDVVRIVDSFDVLNNESIMVIYNLTTSTAISSFNPADFDRINPDHLVYDQLPASLGAKPAADSVSVVLAEGQNKVVVSTLFYKAISSSVAPGEYSINDIVRYVEMQDLSDNTISVAWRNMTTGVNLTSVDISRFVVQPYEAVTREQLPALLGEQLPEDSLSVVVSNQQKFVLISKSTYKAIADAVNTEYVTDDILTRLELYNTVESQTTYVWYNLTQGLDISTPIDVEIALQPDTSGITKVVTETQRYVAILANLEYALNDVIQHTEYVDLVTGQFSHVWWNVTQDVVMTAAPLAAEVTRVDEKQVSSKQLPTTLGRKTSDNSLSVTSANPLVQNFTRFKVITTKPGKYTVGDVLRRWEILDIYKEEVIVRWTNTTTLTSLLAADITAAHLTEIAENEVQIKSVSRTASMSTVAADGTVAPGAINVSFFNIGTVAATVAGGALPAGFSVSFEAPKGDTLDQIGYTCGATSSLIISIVQ